MFHVKQKDGADKKVIDKNPTDEMQHKSAAHVLSSHARRSYKLIRKGNFAGKTCKYNGTNRNGRKGELFGAKTIGMTSAKMSGLEYLS